MNRVNVTSTCGNCAANDHIRDQCKAIPVNAFGQQPSHGNWQVGANMNRNTNFGRSNGQQGFGVQNNQTFFKEKSDTFHYFKMFKKLAKFESEEKVKYLRTDRGGEFNSEEFIS